ncbi:CaiB/BaiF CoA transferase family protein [Micromonospora sp. NPDC005113]
MSGPPLEGLLVLDFTRILAGPLCTMVLADLGADVIKVERPGVGDDTRSWGPPSVGEDATYYLSLNRGKRSIELDLSDPRHLAAARRLAAKADVVVENFRDGVMERLGLDYDTLSADNPGLVYCSIPAFATAGEGKPGYDLLMQAAVGLMSVTGEDRPTKTGVAILDVVTGLYASTGILAALAARQQHGQGQRVVVGLFDASVAALVNQGASYLLGGVVPGLSGNAHPSIVPYQAFSGSDTSFVLACGNDKLFGLLAGIVGAPELASDGRYLTNELRVAHRADLVEELERRFVQQTALHWVKLCDDAGVPASLVRTIDQVFASDEGQSAVFVQPDERRGEVRYVKNPIKLSRDEIRLPGKPPPGLGEHTEQVLAQLDDVWDGAHGVADVPSS